MRGLLVTATDTEVGKTVLASALCARLRAEGVGVHAAKPVVTGTAEPEPGVPADHVLLAACTGQAPEEVAPVLFAPAVSPHLAAAQAGVTLELDALVAAARQAGAAAEVLVVEGVGGLLVPLSPTATVRDYAVDLGLPLVVAARPGLGTINHTALTVEAARAAGLDVRAVVLTPWPAQPSAMERDNAATIAAATGLEVHGLAFSALEPAALAHAARELPVQDWIGSA